MNQTKTKIEAHARKYASDTWYMRYIHCTSRHRYREDHTTLRIIQRMKKLLKAENSRSKSKTITKRQNGKREKKVHCRQECKKSRKKTRKIMYRIERRKPEVRGEVSNRWHACTEGMSKRFIEWLMGCSWLTYEHRGWEGLARQ